MRAVNEALNRSRDTTGHRSVSLRKRCFRFCVAFLLYFSESLTRFTFLTTVSFLSAQFLQMMFVVNSAAVNCRPARISRSQQALFFRPPGPISLRL